MTRWQRGEAEVEKLVRRRELEHMTGAAADGAPLLAQAQRTAATAAGLVQADARSAYVPRLRRCPIRLPRPAGASKACAPLLTEVIMRWNKRSGPSLVRVSGRLQTSGADGTSWNILASPQTQQRRAKPSRLLRLLNV
jgi:hypothetical protein